MSDENAVGVSALLPSGDLPPEERSVSVQKAYARLDEISRSPATQEALARGDRELSDEIKNLTSLVRTPSGVRINERPDATPEARASILDTYLDRADLPPAVQEQVRSRSPVTLQEFRLAQAELSRLKRDKEFVKQLFDGSRAANTRWAMVHIILGSDIIQEAPK